MRHSVMTIHQRMTLNVKLRHEDSNYCDFK